MAVSKSATVPTARKAGVKGVSGQFARAIPAATFSATIDPVLRHELISEAAYFRAERRGFIPGSEVEDWLVAEREIDARLTKPGADEKPTAQADEEEGR